MKSINTVFFILFILNALAIGVVKYHKYLNNLKSRSLQENTQDKLEDMFKFKNKKLALEILNQLDVFKPVNESVFNLFYEPQNFYSLPFMGMAQDNEYCNKTRALFVNDTDLVFKERNFFTEIDYGSLLRGKIIPQVGVDIQHDYFYGIPENTKSTRTIPFHPRINMYYTLFSYHPYQEIGKNMACLHQEYGKVPGQGTLNRKDLVAEAIEEYAKQYQDRPQCFSFQKFFPKTWSLRIKAQCSDFFSKQFNNPEYFELKKKQRIVYIRKEGFGSHRGIGVQPVNDQEELEIRTTWGNGVQCGQVTKNFLMQVYIPNPLLLDGHKFDFRLYMVVASTNPLILYYHDGFLRLSLHPYDVNSDDKSVLLTNTDLSHTVFKDAKTNGQVHGMNETELRNFQMWNFTRLQNYLLEKKVIQDPNWLNNHLRPEFKRAMIHLLRATQYAFLKSSPMFELFGVDFMLDDDLNLWFIECNSGPVLQGSSEEKEIFLTKMLFDHFEIQFMYLRSRMLRVINYVNELIEEKIEMGEESGTLDDVEEKRKVFEYITQNYFELIFEPSVENGFVKIIDENLEGTDRYAHLIHDECL